MSRSRRAPWLLFAAALIALDLWSKALWTYPALDPAAPPRLEQVVVDGWLQIRTIWNYGGVWSVRLPSGLLFAFTLLAVPLLVIWLFWPAASRWPVHLGKALVLGGAVGNLYDRWRFGAVRDFLDVSFGGSAWHWPTFNVADVALVVGIGLLLLTGWARSERRVGAAAENAVHR